MDFELSDDQVALVDGVRTFLAGRFSIGAVRALADRGGVDRAAWQELADLGVFSLRQGVDAGGAGLGWADAVLVFEELGRSLVPGPLVWTHLAADLVPGAADGAVVVGGLDRRDPWALVEHPDALDQVLVVDGDGLWVTPPAALDLRPLGNPLDPLTPVARAHADVRGEQVGDCSAVAALDLLGGALVAGALLGIATATTDSAVAYAHERVQFDRPIGSFQALKHVMADMLARAEVARGAVYAAGVTLDDPEVGDPERAVAAAKLCATEAALANGASCVQVHGGMGYTWEVDAHLYLKRAYALATVFGSSDRWAERMADLVAAGTPAPTA